nr:tetratricopeptide repeat protein [Phycisphaerales bacterium]
AGTAGVWRYIVAIDRERIRAVTAERQTAAHLAEVQRERSITQSVNAFLQGVLSAADPNLLGHDVKMLDAVRFSAGEIRARFRKQPQVEGKVRATLGSTYRMLGLFPDARSELERALAIQERELGPAHRDTLWTRLALLALAGDEGGSGKLLPQYRRLADDAADALGSGDSLTLAARMTLGLALANDHLFGEAAAVLDGVVSEASAGSEIDPENLHKARIALAQNRFYLGESARAIEELEACIRDLGQTLGEDNIARLNAMTILSAMYFGTRRPEEARRWGVAAYEGMKRTLPPGHDLLFTAAREIAILDLSEGNPLGAIDILEQEIETFLNRPGHNPVQLPRSWEVLGNAYARADRLEEAATALLRARAGFAEMLGGEENSIVRRISASLARVYERLGRDDLRDEHRRKAGQADPATGQEPRR